MSELSGHIGLTPSERIIAAQAAIQQQLKDVVEALRSVEVPFAIVGDQATSLWIATVDQRAIRTARDMEILLRRQDFQSVSTTLAKLGLKYSAAGQPRFLLADQPTFRNDVRIVWEDSAFAEHRIPISLGIESIVLLGGFPVLSLDHHIATSLAWDRLDDRVNLLDMIGVGLVSAAMVNRFPDVLAVRLTEILDEYCREQHG